MKKTFSFTFEVGEEYTDGFHAVKIVGFTDNHILVNTGGNSDIPIEVKQFIIGCFRPIKHE